MDGFSDWDFWTLPWTNLYFNIIFSIYISGFVDQVEMVWQWQEELNLWEYICVLYFQQKHCGAGRCTDLAARGQFVSARACSVPPGTAQGLLCCVAFQTPSSGSGVDSVHSRAAAGPWGLPWQLWTCQWLTWGMANRSGAVLQAYQNETFCFRIPASHGRFCAVKFSLEFLFISCTMWSLKSTVADWLD